MCQCVGAQAGGTQAGGTGRSPDRVRWLCIGDGQRGEPLKRDVSPTVEIGPEGIQAKELLFHLARSGQTQRSDQRSRKPLPERIFGTDFSTRSSRVFACLASEK